jgi:hypothetical protein
MQDFPERSWMKRYRFPMVENYPAFRPFLLPARFHGASLNRGQAK